jgi:hypothetical protein
VGRKLIRYRSEFTPRLHSRSRGCRLSPSSSSLTHLVEPFSSLDRKELLWMVMLLTLTEDDVVDVDVDVDVDVAPDICLPRTPGRKAEEVRATIGWRR